MTRRCYAVRDNSATDGDPLPRDDRTERSDKTAAYCLPGVLLNDLHQVMPADRF